MTDPNIAPASFSTLPLEIKQRIWKLTLPASRIIRVIPATPTSKEESTENPASSSNTASSSSPISLPDLPATPSYKTLPASWGGTIPQALHINSESRAFALTLLTERFNCYWNFNIDLLYVELPFLGQAGAASKQLYDMWKRGLLNGVKHLAVDWEMWDMYPWPKEHCSQTIINQQGLESCTFILRPNYERINKLDVTSPGVPWSVIPPLESYQVELGMEFMGRVEKGLKCVHHGTRLGPEDLRWKMIGDRKTVETRNYEFRRGPEFLEWIERVQGDDDWFG